MIKKDEARIFLTELMCAQCKKIEKIKKNLEKWGGVVYSPNLLLIY